MIPALCAVAAVLAAQCCLGADGTPSAVSTLPPAPEGVSIEANLSYLEPGRQEKLDLYLPANRPPGKRSPGIVIIHGGGWTAGDKASAREFSIGTDLAKAGYVCASINYCLTKGRNWPQQLFDCKNAVRFLRANAWRYRVDPEHIGVIGGSAGGHLSLMVAYTSGVPEFEPSTPYPGIRDDVQGVVDMYGLTNLFTRQKTDPNGNPTGERRALSSFASGTRYSNAEGWKLGSPVFHVKRDSPPTLILHGKADTTVDRNQAVELAAKLTGSGVEHELILLDAVGHTFDLHSWNHKPLPVDVHSAVVGFFDKHLKSANRGETSKMRKVSDFIIYQDDKYYCAFPSLVMRKDGEILCAFRRAPNRVRFWNAPGYSHTDANSYLVLVRSKDSGKTWTDEPELILAHPLGGSQDPCMAQLADGSIVCTSYGWALVPEQAKDKLQDTMVHPSYAFLGGYLVRSEDGGKSWRGPIVPMHVPVDATLDALGQPVAAYNRGEMIQRKDGKLYWAVCANKADQPRRASVHLLTSSDRGETWEYACQIAEDDVAQFNETSLVETAKGDIVAFMRTEDFGGKIAYARSTDGGKSFGKWQNGEFFGHPFQATRLADGRVFLIYGYRKEPFGIRAKLLNPECTDIVEAPELVIRDDGGNGDLGYPWSVQLKDGRILAAYYFNKGDGPRHIAGSVIAVDRD